MKATNVDVPNNASINLMKKAITAYNEQNTVAKHTADWCRLDGIMKK